MTHRVADEFLLDHAAGTAPEPIAVLVATHVALNAASRRALRQLETIGGALLSEVAPAATAADALERTLSRLGPQEPPGAAPSFAGRLPAPLQAYVPHGLDALRWRTRGRGLAEAVLACTTPSAYRLSLLRMAPGGGIPRHGHRGPEFVLVLSGGFSDQRGRYGPGDVCFADESVEHRPVADADGECLCLAVTRGPVRLKGLLGLVLNPFMGA